MRFILCLCLLAGCASRDLRWEIASLNAQMAMMNQRVSALEANVGEAQQPANETTATEILTRAMEAYEQLDFDTAKSLVETVWASFSTM